MKKIIGCIAVLSLFLPSLAFSGASSLTGEVTEKSYSGKQEVMTVKYTTKFGCGVGDVTDGHSPPGPHQLRIITDSEGNLLPDMGGVVVVTS